MKKCSNCGADNADEARFCLTCGTELAASCSNCGNPLPSGARFCPSCGHIIVAAAAAEERKLVTILFADVTGSTALGERLDPERLKEVLDAYFAAMREEIEAEGGTVEKFIGDAVMAVFGAPVAHEDDPARALRAALGMGRRLATLNESLKSSHDIALEMRIGVNVGEVMAVTDTRRGMGLVTGDPVNVAARLEQNAQPGEVLVAERVARATRGFRFADVGPLSLKGKGDPVRALRLVADERSSERGIPGLSAPLIGRDSEMAVLRSVFDRVAAERRPHLVTVYGDPGVGKSRLVAEFMQRLEAGPNAPLVLSGRCLPYGEGITYWPFAEILKSLAGALDSDPPDLVVGKIRKVGRELLTPDVADEPARAAAALAYTVGVEDPDVSFRDLPPRQVRLEIHGAWRSFFSGLAADRAVVALIEDIHWADSAMLDLLEELAERVEGPVMLVCPARPELTQRRASWGGGKRNASSIFLDPLSDDEAGRLVALLLSIDELAPDVHDRILARAEGNPFFLEEIIRHLIDEGSIVHEGGRWRATPGCGDVQIPDTVQAVLAARVDLLSPAEKRVVQSAAVVGRVFWTGPLRRLLGEEITDIDEILDRLAARELIRARLSSSIGGDREYIFKHVLTRDVAYESLPRRERSSSHAQVGAWLKETAGERRNEFAELLAYHYGEAYREAGSDHRLDASRVEALRAAAFEHVLLASEVARKRFVVDGALRLGETVLGLAASALERSSALETLGLAHQLDYQGDAAWRCLKQAVDEAVAARVTDHRRIAMLCAVALETPTRWPGSMQVIPVEEKTRPYLDLGMRHAELIEGDSEELVRMLTAKGLWPFGFPAGRSEEDFDQAVADGERGAGIARRLGRPELESGALDASGSAWILRGLYLQAEEVVGRRVGLAAQIRDVWEIADLFAVESWTHFIRGRYEESVRAADEGIRRARENIAGMTLHNFAWLALAHFRLAQWDDALENLRVIQELLGDRRGRPPMFVSRPFGVSALIQEIRGNSAAADELMTTLARVEPGRDGVTGSSPWLAPLMLRRGLVGEGLALVDEALDNPRWPGLRAPTYEALCDALVEAGAWDRAREEAPKLRAYAERGGFQTLPFFVDRLEGRMRLMEGHEERAVELLSSSAAGFGKHRAAWEEAQSLVVLGEVLFSLGRNDEASTALRRADETFERVRAERDRDRVRDLLGR